MSLLSFHKSLEVVGDEGWSQDTVMGPPRVTGHSRTELLPGGGCVTYGQGQDTEAERERLLKLTGYTVSVS